MAVIYDLWLLAETHFVVLLLQYVRVKQQRTESQYIQHGEHDNLHLAVLVDGKNGNMNKISYANSFLITMKVCSNRNAFLQYYTCKTSVVKHHRATVTFAFIQCPVNNKLILSYLHFRDD